MINQFFVFLLALACASASTLSAMAVPVSYSESVSGDITGSSPLTSFVLDLGVNTVSGTLGSVSSAVTDLDSFAITVPAGQEIFSGLLVLSDNTGNILENTWNLNAGSASLGGGAFVEVINANSPGAHLFSSVPLGANVYNLTHAFFSSDGPHPNLANYTFEFSVRQVVPEPAACAIALAGLGCVMGLRSRRRLA